MYVCARGVFWGDRGDGVGDLMTVPFRKVLLTPRMAYSSSDFSIY